MSKVIGQVTKLPISIIIPTYSEEKALPRLLQSISSQLIGVEEVIVADAFSKDATRAIAQEYGCVVVDGGRIGVGRNAGAKVAKYPYLLFLDADTVLPKETTIIEAFAEFLKIKCDIASAIFVPDRVGASNFGIFTSSLVFGSLNSVRKIQQITQKFVAEGGAFILTKREVFDRLKGFETSIDIGEDRDFFVRAVKLGYRYACLSQRVLTSTRRYSTPRAASKNIMSLALQGVLLAAGIYAGSELYKRLTTKGYGKMGGGSNQSKG